MNKKIKKLYFEPVLQVFKIDMGDRLLTMSGSGANLDGAGVDESDANTNGDNTW